MDPSEMERRLKVIEELKKSVELLQAKVNLKFLSENESESNSDYEKEISYTICPLDKGHKVPSDRLERHLQKCVLRKNGYSEKDKLYPDVWIPEGANSAIKIGTEEICKILNKTPTNSIDSVPEIPPQSLDRYQSMFSNSERLQIYEHVLKNTKLEKDSEINLGFNLANNDLSTNQNSSFVDELALQRDLKRRRAKYRKPASRGYKQELKDTIETQMEMYTKYIQKKMEEDNPDKKYDLKTDTFSKSDSEEKTSKYTNDGFSKKYMEDRNYIKYNKFSNNSSEKTYDNDYKNHRNYGESSKYRKDNFSKTNFDRNYDSTKHVEYRNSDEKIKNYHKYDEFSYKNVNYDKNNKTTSRDRNLDERKSKYFDNDEYGEYRKKPKYAESDSNNYETSYGSYISKSIQINQFELSEPSCSRNEGISKISERSRNKSPSTDLENLKERKRHKNTKHKKKSHKHKKSDSDSDRSKRKKHKKHKKSSKHE